MCHSKELHPGAYLFSLACLKAVYLLGPLLFLIYINDLPQSVPHSTVYLFADDTKLISVSSTPEDDNLLQTDLNSLQSWCSKWKLKLNADKCVSIHFTHSLPSCPPSLTINNTQIEFVFSHRDVGVALTNHLSWSIHYNHICSKAYAALNLIRRTITTSSINVKKQLYLSLVRSQLTYCSQLWRPRLLKDITQLERVQRRVLT